MTKIDPLGLPKILAGSYHYFRTCVRTSVRPHFQNIAKQTLPENNYYYSTGETVGLAEEIIDEICLLLIFSQDIILHFYKNFSFYVYERKSTK